MTTEKKIAANRRNAQKSTGPKSGRGKSLARFNALKSGLYAASRLLPGEDHGAYRRLSKRLLERFQPTDPIEELIVDQILSNIWRIQRLERAERAYLEKVDEARSRRVTGSAVSCHCVAASRAGAVKFLPGAEPARGTGASSGDENACERGHDLGTIFLEATISQFESQPLVHISKQRRALLNDVLTGQGVIESNRSRAFKRFSGWPGRAGPIRSRRMVRAVTMASED
jgi:hypothetical protein